MRRRRRGPCTCSFHHLTATQNTARPAHHQASWQPRDHSPTRKYEHCEDQQCENKECENQKHTTPMRPQASWQTWDHSRRCRDIPTCHKDNATECGVGGGRLKHHGHTEARWGRTVFCKWLGVCAFRSLLFLKSSGLSEMRTLLHHGIKSHDGALHCINTLHRIILNRAGDGVRGPMHPRLPVAAGTRPRRALSLARADAIRPAGSSVPRHTPTLTLPRTPPAHTSGSNLPPTPADPRWADPLSRFTATRTYTLPLARPLTGFLSAHASTLTFSSHHCTNALSWRRSSRAPTPLHALFSPPPPSTALLHPRVARALRRYRSKAIRNS